MAARASAAASVASTEAVALVPWATAAAAMGTVVMAAEAASMEAMALGAVVAAQVSAYCKTILYFLL